MKKNILIHTFKEIPYWLSIPALVMAANGLLYPIVGTENTLYLLDQLFGATYPDTAFGVPPIEHFKVSFLSSPTSIMVHYVSMPFVLLLGLVQFSNTIRIQRPQLHRNLGILFLVLVFIGVSSGMVRVLNGNVFGGPLTKYQFIGMGVFTMTCAIIGITMVWKKNYLAHQQWMFRTYLILWSSSIISRVGILLWVPCAWQNDFDTKLEFYTVPYNVALTFSWAFALLIADVLIAHPKRFSFLNNSDVE